MTNTTQTSQEIHLYLKELNVIPEEYKTNRLTSKGFFDEVTIQDFPIRGVNVFLHVTRRRWLLKDTITSIEKLKAEIGNIKKDKSIDKLEKEVAKLNSEVVAKEKVIEDLRGKLKGK